MPPANTTTRGRNSSVVKYICLFLTCPCWAPLVCLLLYYNIRRNIRRSKNFIPPKTKEEEEALFLKRRIDNAPVPLPKSRARSLTLRLSPPAAHGKAKKKDVTAQRTIDQLESSILYRLPLEIRIMVWEHALGGNHVHITRKRKRLGHAICPNPNLAIEGGKELCTATRDGYGFWRATEYPKKMSPLSLLKTCRQMCVFPFLCQTRTNVGISYSEAIDTLYSCNTFSFNDLDAVLSFQSTVLPCRFKLIQSLELIWEFQQSPHHWRPLGWHTHPPYDPHTWEQTCDILATMDHLRSLTVIADMRWQRTMTTANPGFNPRLLEPLCKIHVNGTFEVFVTWPEYHPVEMEIVHKGIPFQIRRLPEPQVDWVEVEVPFDVHCLHCPDKRIIPRGSQGMAHQSTEHDSTLMITQKYWLAHTHCGGWIEFSHLPETGEDFVTQGGERVS